MTRGNTLLIIYFLKLNHFIPSTARLELQKCSTNLSSLNLFSRSNIFHPTLSFADRKGQKRNKFPQYFSLELVTGSVPKDNVITSIY